MDYREYLAKARQAEIRINGLKGTTRITKRPKLRELKAILKNRQYGTVTFTDIFETEATKVLIVKKGVLWYGDTKVDMREIPDLYMESGDTMHWEFSVSITCEPKGFTIKS